MTAQQAAIDFGMLRLPVPELTYRNWPHSLWRWDWCPTHVVDEETAQKFAEAMRERTVLFVDWESARFWKLWWLMSEQPLMVTEHPLDELLAAIADMQANGYQPTPLKHQVTDGKGKRNHVERMLYGYGDVGAFGPYRNAPYTLEQMHHFYPTFEPRDLEIYHGGVDAAHRDALRAAGQGGAFRAARWVTKRATP